MKSSRSNTRRAPAKRTAARRQESKQRVSKPKNSRPRGAQPKKEGGGLGAALTSVASYLGKFGLVAVLGAAVYGASHALASLELIPVERVMFAGEFRKVQKENLVKRVSPYLEAGYLGLDLSAMREDLEAEPWVYSIRVSRQWPRKLEITVVEEQPIARWNQNGLMNHKGELFSAENKILGREYRDLPLLRGAAGTESLVVEQFWLMNQQMADYDLSIAELTFTPQREWRLELADGQLLVLPEKDYNARLARFFQVYRQNLHTSFSNVVQLDLRYQQGIAIEWRAENET